MKRVYNAPDLIDAQLVGDLLEHAGIATHIFNANAASSLGLIPISAGRPQVWVVQPHQEALARHLIAAYQLQVPQSTNWTCAACGEGNPGEFELCWNCAKSAP